MSIKHLEILDNLGLQNDEYVILGSAAAIAHGYDATNDDIDLLVTTDAFKRIESKLIQLKVINDVLMYTDNEKGVLDISTETLVFDNVEEPFILSELIDDYRYLSKEGLMKFYIFLYSQFKKEKHKTVLDWLKTT